MRDSGLAHILSVSGLHIVFVVGLVMAIAALASALLVPAGQARDLAVSQEPAAPSRP